jgi:transposase-like protein
MTFKNRYVKRAKTSEAKFRLLIKCFVHDLETKTIVSLTGLNRNTVNRYLTLIRKHIAEYCEQQFPAKGEIRVDKPYSVGRKNEGKRKRRVCKKTQVFGIIKRRSKVYTEIVPDCAKSILQDVIRGRVDPDSIIYYDVWRGYNGFVDLGHKKHYIVNNRVKQLVTRKYHINSIESFWAFSKGRLTKFRGIAASTFYLHLKECEFRFNYRNKNLYKILLKMFREKPLS